MTTRTSRLSLHVLFWVGLSLPPIYASDYQVRFIPFEDLKPDGARLTVCWAGIGIDHNQRVYFAASDENDSRPDDTVIFRYDTKTETRQLLGTLRGISEAQKPGPPREHRQDSRLLHGASGQDVFSLARLP